MINGLINKCRFEELGLQWIESSSFSEIFDFDSHEKSKQIKFPPKNLNFLRPLKISSQIKNTKVIKLP